MPIDELSALWRAAQQRVNLLEQQLALSQYRAAHPAASVAGQPLPDPHDLQQALAVARANADVLLQRFLEESSGQRRRMRAFGLASRSSDSNL